MVGLNRETVHDGEKPISPLLVTCMPSTPHGIQSHIYDSFLKKQTVDVVLRVQGTWSALYKLHRVVLIQSVIHFNHDHT